MRASQIHKRLENLMAKVHPYGKREFTLEELCRASWRLDNRGFLACMKEDFPGLRAFAEMFQREDAERAARTPGRAPAGHAGPRGCQTKKAAFRR
jgi:hypothetical protein